MEAEETVLDGVFNRVEICSEFPAVHKEWLVWRATIRNRLLPTGRASKDSRRLTSSKALEKYLHEHKPLE